MNGPLHCPFEKQIPIAKRSSKQYIGTSSEPDFDKFPIRHTRLRWLTNISQRRDSVEPPWPLITALNLQKVHLRGDLWIIFPQSVVSSHH